MLATSLLQTIHTSSARLEQAGVSFGHGTHTPLEEAPWQVRWAQGQPRDEQDSGAEQPHTP
ncbi:MAG: 50S ribosomal protein L3 N(5)-glutamine methyltransferase, partial [Rubrivivax sp.]